MEDNQKEGGPGKVAEVIESVRQGRGKLRLLAWLFAAFIAVMFFSPFVIIGAGQRGVVLNFGAVQDVVLGEGLHFRIPIMQSIEKIDVRVQKAQTDAESVSKDLQDTRSVIALNFHISPEKAGWLFQNLGSDYKTRVIDPTIQEVVKAVTAKYTAEELITQREKVRTEIMALLKARLVSYNIMVDDFSIVNFAFSKEFTHAIEEKQVAQQKALKAQRDLERIKIEAEQKIAQAKAEAESLRMQKENVTPQLVQLRRIEASIKAIEKWDGKLPKLTGAGVPFIDMREPEKEGGNK
ncbi:MAG TPA: prohibitin family protein [Dissulfurispiraceae bacterium]|nr:prohibitin family protein [Dissulfurispiraceae bacterium]